MSGFDAAFQHRLEVNSWTMYSIGMLLIGLRFFAQLRKREIRNLKTDDYLMIVAAVWYTILIASLHVIVEGGGSNLFLPDELPALTHEEIQDRIYGSKIVVVSEQAMLNVIYTLKACLLILYARLTQTTALRKLVSWLSIYIVVGYAATQIGFFAACRPFNGYWAVPPPNPQCTTLEYYAINQGVWNISSDLLILFIPMPLLIRVKLPLKQKLVLCGVFSMGAYVILAAILTKAFNLSNVYDPSYMLWYTREASVAVYVANLPILWPWLREWLPWFRNSKSVRSLPLSTYESLGPNKKRFSLKRFSRGEKHRESTVIITGGKDVVPKSSNGGKLALVSLPKGMPPVREEAGMISLPTRPSMSYNRFRPSSRGKTLDVEFGAEKENRGIMLETSFQVESSTDVMEASERAAGAGTSKSFDFDSSFEGRNSTETTCGASRKGMPPLRDAKRVEIVSSIGRAKVRKI